MRSGRAFQAFVELKSAMVTAHVPALPNYSISFVVETYASDIGILVILMQHDHPISFIGKVLYAFYVALSVYEKELLTFIFAFTTWSTLHF